MELENLQSDASAVPQQSVDSIVPSEVVAPMVQQPADEKLSETGVTPEQTAEGQPEAKPDDLDAELEKELDEALKAKPAEQTEHNFFRKLARNEKRNTRIEKTRAEELQQKLAGYTDSPIFSDPDQARFATDLVTGLSSFDIEQGRPTAKPFAEKLVAKSPELAKDAFYALAFQSSDPKTGLTFGHEFLKEQGLDPALLQEFRDISAGKRPLSEYGFEDMPSQVPLERVEAWKALSKPMRDHIRETLETHTDDDQYSREQRQAALEVLNDKYVKIESEKQRLAQEQFDQQQLQEAVNQGAMQALGESFDRMLEAIPRNPVYAEISVSSDPVADTQIKESLVSDLVAVASADLNPVLARTAIRRFEKLGVQIDLQEVSNLMQTLEESARIVKQIEKRQEIQRRTNPSVDYSTQINTAKIAGQDAERRLTARGYQIIGQALTSLSKGKAQSQQQDPRVGLPNFGGASTSAISSNQEVRSFADVERIARQAAGAVQASNSGSN